MLQGMTWASPPAFLMPSATATQASALRLEITTLAPSLAISSAEERPMPRLEPVMTATFPVRSNGVPFTIRTPCYFRHCEERSDDAIHSFFARRDGLLRFARNDALI